MYVGHIAVALAATRARRTVPLWVLLLASQWPDWVQLFLSALGAYNAQLYSHSLPAIAGGATLFALIYLRQSHNVRGTWLVWGVYVSHSLLDLITGLKPLWPGGRPIGANLYDRPGLDFTLETLVAIIGWLIYRRQFDAHPRRGYLVFILVTLVACQALADLGQQVQLMRRAGILVTDNGAAARRAAAVMIRMADESPRHTHQLHALMSP